MKRFLLAISTVLALANVAPAAAQSAACVRGQFPSTSDAVPTDWKGPVFQLKQDYPDTLPARQAYPWLNVPFANNRIQDPAAYAAAVKAWVLRGNTRPGHEFSAADNTARRWYNLPWMHYGPGGNEFTHGLVHEIDRQAGYLHAAQTQDVSVWAITIINDRAAYGVGQVWCDPNNPRPDHLNGDPADGKPNSFAEGSVIAKALFFTMGPSQVPFLDGSLTWDANVNQFAEITTPACNTDVVFDPAKQVMCPANQSCNIGVCFGPRKLARLWLAQLDFAVRDSRASETGWVFGTWAYNSKWPGATWSDRLALLGVTWGNDPGITPAMAAARPGALKQTWINAKADPCPSGVNCNGIFGKGNHIGYGGRLDGGADEKTSACLSCHMGAGFIAGAPGDIPQSPVLFPDIIDPQMSVARRMAWFKNTPAGVPLNTDMWVSTDYSLQLAMGIQHFYLSRASDSVRARHTRQILRAMPPR